MSSCGHWALKVFTSRSVNLVLGWSRPGGDPRPPRPPCLRAVAPRPLAGVPVVPHTPCLGTLGPVEVLRPAWPLRHPHLRMSTRWVSVSITRRGSYRQVKQGPLSGTTVYFRSQGMRGCNPTERAYSSIEATLGQCPILIGTLSQRWTIVRPMENVASKGRQWRRAGNPHRDPEVEGDRRLEQREGHA